ncbi:MAG: competence protein ComEC [Sphingomonadales bacterium]|nr:competence protein ComEC [Sphingomonadales bacterium]
MTKASKIAVTLLDVGQGSGTFVEIYTGTATPTATALLDLGSERAKDEAGGPSVDFIEKQLKSMAKPRIDFLSLSHSDSDHINLLQDLLSRFDKPGTKKPAKPILEIGTVIYGGPRDLYAKHGGTNVISDVEGYQPKGAKKPQPLPANNCSYSQPTPVFEINDVSFNLLVGNHIRSQHTKRTKITDKEWKFDSYSLNTYSLIFVVVFNGWRYVVTGDATGATISKANDYIAQYKATFANVAVMTMPHHSSETTTFGLSGSKRPRSGKRVSDAAKKVIDTFAKSINGQSIHASAEEVGSFRHPSAYTMSYFWEYVTKTGWYDDPELSDNQHLYNAYFVEDDGYIVVEEEEDPVTKKKNKKKVLFPTVDDWWTLASRYAIFTNRYYVRDQAYDPDKDQTATFPPDPGKTTAIPKSGAVTSLSLAVAWIYTTDATTGTTSIARLENRKTATAAFVTTPVMELTKDDAPAPAAVAVAPVRAAHPVRRRHMGPRPPAHRTPLRRMRQIDG